MQKNDFNKIIILILIIELFFIFFANKTYSPDYYAYLKRYDYSHIYLFGNPNSDFYIEHFNRRKLSEYNWLNLNLFTHDPYYSIQSQSLLRYLFSLNSFLFFDLILFFFRYANVDFNIFLNVISTFNALVLFFFFKKIFNLFKHSDYSYASLIIFFLFISNFFLEFYFIRIKSGLCFSFLFLSYIFFKKKIILSIILFLISCFIHPLYSALYFFLIVIPSCVEFFKKKKVIVYSIVVVTSITILFFFYVINIYLNQSKYEINIYRLLFYTLFPLIIFVYLINNKYNFNMIKNEKFFIFFYFVFVLGSLLLMLFSSQGFSGQTFLRFYSFLSIPAIIYIVKINNCSKSLLYNYIVVINFLFFFRSYFFGSI
jgi:hypothetical protein